MKTNLSISFVFGFATISCFPEAFVCRSPSRSCRKVLSFEKRKIFSQNVCRSRKLETRSSKLFKKSRNSNDSYGHRSNETDVAFWGLSVVSLVTSTCTLWSEATIFKTGCGPIYMSDFVERVSYQAVLMVSGLAWFIRIVFRQGLGDFATEQGFLPSHDKKTKHKWSRKVLGMAETTAYLAALLAVVVLVNQMQNNVEMDGLSGIDIAACKARRDFVVQSHT